MHSTATCYLMPRGAIAFGHARSLPDLASQALSLHKLSDEAQQLRRISILLEFDSVFSNMKNSSSMYLKLLGTNGYKWMYTCVYMKYVSDPAASENLTECETHCPTLLSAFCRGRAQCGRCPLPGSLIPFDCGISWKHIETDVVSCAVLIPRDCQQQRANIGRR